MLEHINNDKIAKTIKMEIVGAGRSQTEVRLKLDIDRIFLNAFLNRRIDLLPSDIDRLVGELGLQKTIVRLSAPAGENE